MSVGAVGQITTLTYGALYLPLFSLVYLKNAGAESVTIFQIPFLPLSGFGFAVALSITFFGSLTTHAMLYSIFGEEGARQNPKDNWTIRYQRAALMFSSNPGLRPNSGADLRKRIRSFTEETFSSLPLLLARGLRAIFLSGLRTGYGIILLVSTYALLRTVFVSSISYIGFGLLLGQGIFITKSFVWNRFPAVVPEEAIPWIHIPEYARADKSVERGDSELVHSPKSASEVATEFMHYTAERANERDLDSVSEEADWLVDIDDEEVNYMVDLPGESDDDQE